MLWNTNIETAAISRERDVPANKKIETPDAMETWNNHGVANNGAAKSFAIAIPRKYEVALFSVTSSEP
jgi:hypothetical protein